MTTPRIIVALDVSSEQQALALAGRLQPGLCRLKVGLELFVSAGPAIVAKLQERGYEIFLDLKFHDIPNTVAQACRAAARLGVWMVNVHALGGERMLAAARAAIDSEAHRPLLTAVTILTSHGDQELARIGLAGDAADGVIRLAQLSHEAGMDGIVCSPWEAAVVRARLGDGFVLVTPGVRPVQTTRDDQQRVMTPAQALAQGANYLVIGRPVTAADDPLFVLDKLNAELGTLDSVR